MLKPVKPRGDTSVAFLSTGLYIKEPANICHGISIRTTALESVSSLQMCAICTDGTHPAPCKELQV